MACAHYTHSHSFVMCSLFMVLDSGLNVCCVPVHNEYVRECARMYGWERFALTEIDVTSCRVFVSCFEIRSVDGCFFFFHVVDSSRFLPYSFCVHGVPSLPLAYFSSHYVVCFAEASWTLKHSAANIQYIIPCVLITYGMWCVRSLCICKTWEYTHIYSSSIPAPKQHKNALFVDVNLILFLSHFCSIFVWGEFIAPFHRFYTRAICCIFPCMLLLRHWQGRCFSNRFSLSLMLCLTLLLAHFMWTVALHRCAELINSLCHWWPLLSARRWSHLSLEANWNIRFNKQVNEG